MDPGQTASGQNPQELPVMGTPVVEDEVGLPSADAQSKPRLKSKLQPLPPLNSNSPQNSRLSSPKRDRGTSPVPSPAPAAAAASAARPARVSPPRREAGEVQEVEGRASSSPVSITPRTLPGQPMPDTDETEEETNGANARSTPQPQAAAASRISRISVQVASPTSSPLPSSPVMSMSRTSSSQVGGGGVGAIYSRPRAPSDSTAMEGRTTSVSPKAARTASRSPSSSPKGRPRRRSLHDAMEAGSALVGTLFNRAASTTATEGESSMSGTGRRRASLHEYTRQGVAREQEKTGRPESNGGEKKPEGGWFSGRRRSSHGSAVSSSITRALSRASSSRKSIGQKKAGVIDRIFRPFSSHSQSESPQTGSPLASPFMKSSRSGDAAIKSNPIKERTHSPMPPESLATKIQRRKVELAKRDGNSSGETAKSRWVKANWHALEQASATRTAVKQEHSDSAQLQNQEKFANMVNVLMYAVTWRRKALGARVHEGEGEEQRHKPPFIERVFSHPAYVFLNWLFSMFAIFAWDINVMAGGGPGVGDDVVLGCNASLLFVFLLDWCLRLASFKRPFLTSVESAADLLAIVSLLPDLVWFTARIDFLQTHHTSNFPVAIRALRVGFRALRSARLVSFAIRARARRPVHNLPQDLKGDLDSMPRTSVAITVAHAVEYQAVLVVAVLVFLQMVVSALWFEGLSSYRLEGFAAVLHMICNQHDFSHEKAALGSQTPSTLWLPGGVDPSLQRSVDAFVEGNSNISPVLYLAVNETRLFGDAGAIEGLRAYPPEGIVLETFSESRLGSYCEMHLDASELMRRAAQKNLTMVLVIIASLVLFSSATKRMLTDKVVKPMERMEAAVLAFFARPLRPATHTLEQHTRETFIVENALLKLGSLLRLGFGEAGAKIVHDHLHKGTIDTNMPGKIVNAFYGFLDIRNFTDMTEVLQADVVKVVNTIASHVHAAVTDNYGSPNKNIGDAFLVVWKPNRGKKVQEVADAALQSFIRIIIEVSRSKELSRIARRTDVQARLPGHQIRMGFGMHHGWSVEGAIGSSIKIDASYLSPHVNLAARLESATKLYGVTILISEDMLSLMSPKVKQLVRIVDRVTVKGSIKPMKLYTYDVPLCVSQGGTLHTDIDVSTLPAAEFFDKIQPSITKEHREQFHIATDFYLGGQEGAGADWVAAAVLLRECLAKHPEDTLAEMRLKFIVSKAREDGSAPEGWRGFRALDEK